MADKTMDDILSLLCSHTKLERDKGLQVLEEKLKDTSNFSSDSQRVTDFQNSLASLVESTDRGWEAKHGGLIGSKVLILNNLGSDDFTEALRKQALLLMHDDEARVRIASGEMLGALCTRKGPDIYVACREEILKSVSDNLERKLPDSEELTGGLMHKLTGGENDTSQETHKRADAAQIFHDTAGWKHLETSMRCLQSVIEGCGKAFNEHITQNLLDLIFQALNHTNRFVRETGYQLCGSLVRLGRVEDKLSGATLSPSVNVENNAILKHGEQFADYLKKGLSDNWSQVRLAASVATRQFLQTLPNSESRERFYPKILPAMCLNRYYVAEGVRIYCQQSWKMVVGTEGKQLVEKYITEIVEFYISQTKADNHAVREAACACIAELGTKVDQDCLRSHVSDLLHALVCCFKDDSWPVRDAACVACGNFVLCFPEECSPSMDELYPLFFGNLADGIPSVRQGAAMSLGNVVKAYGESALVIVLKKITEGLQGVKEQEATTEKYAGIEQGPATFGVIKRLRDNDMELHTDRQMYSCGSLAPKMRRGGGCADHLFRRPAEPWEKADGCVDLLAELSANPKTHKEVIKLIPLVSEAAHHKHYTQHLHLLETVCTQLPVIAKGIGKNQFKRYLELFIDIIFYSLKSDNALTSTAASECLSQFSTLLGPSILRGRIEMHNPR
ncbi:unnamed protein product [Porites evermanni]|uniref:Dynein axonemal assembly factor 5 TPR repeats domain-containing protein n=1 Tax=Porites evermanni TaxID=104178 RepID=A0ABN8Q6I6_9CNID|nr:unnamed protein product [Porites evermanni]